jgi:ubiquinone/menaquinone biosynthesis C-methylase UbiE
MNAAALAVLACPCCHSALEPSAKALSCGNRACGFGAEIRDDVVCALASGDRASFFDAHHGVMTHGSEQANLRAAFYDRQAAALVERLADAKVILDIGCGPRLPYERPPQALVLGVDPSFESLRENVDVDLRIHASASWLPVASGSVDAIVCFYSLHHVVGTTVKDNRELVRRTLTEFARVLTSAGRVVVFEVAPWWAAWAVQRVAWNAVRHIFGGALNMFFWRQSELISLVTTSFRSPSAVESIRFQVPPLTMFPPAFALQKLRLPRVLYPFNLNMYTWRSVGGGAINGSVRATGFSSDRGVI